MSLKTNQDYHRASNLSQVPIMGQSSSPKRIDNGVIQGSSLEPLLFVIFESGEGKFWNGQIFLYSDNTTLLFEGDNWENVGGNAERGLLTAKRWFDQNRFTVNLSKTKCMSNSLKADSDPTNLEIRLHTCGAENGYVTCDSVECVTEYKYLGVVFDNRMKWSGHVNYIRTKLHGLVAGGTLAYVGSIFLLISFISPYWVQSYEETSSAFKHMGLWQYCFDQFRYPYHQFDKMFDGCHYIYSDEYYVIREWLLPGWLLAIQAWMTLSFMLSFGSLVIIALIVVRYPLRFILHYEWLLTGIAFVCIAVSSFLMFISVWLFWTQSSRRDWLMYPNFNHLSYSYYFGVFSFFIHTYAAYILYHDSRRAYDLRRESKNLVMQMYDTNSRNGFV